MWKEITGYHYRYRINEDAVVQRYWPTKNEWRNMSPFRQTYGQKAGYRLCVHLTVERNVHKNVFVTSLMAEYFMGGRAANPGKVIVHKNKLSSDCALHNLAWRTVQEAGRMCGGNGRRAVEKIDRDGNVVALYRSTVECSSREFISRKALWRITHNQVVDPYALTGYTYRYEEE